MLWGEGAQGAGLPLLHALRPRPLRGTPQEVGGDPEEGEVLEGQRGPSLGAGSAGASVGVGANAGGRGAGLPHTQSPDRSPVAVIS